MLPFGYKKWKRIREFKKIWNEMMQLTGGNDFGFTYQTYKENRGGFMVSYSYPILSAIPTLICLASLGLVQKPTPVDLKNAGLFALGIFLLHASLMLKDFLKRKEDMEIDLHDVLSHSDLSYMMGKSDTLETNLFLHKLSKTRNERSLLLIQNKEYMKELTKIPSIISHARKVEESFNYVKKSKTKFTEKEYELKKDKLLSSFLDSQKKVQKAIHSTLVAIGNKKTMEQEKQEELHSKKNVNQLLNEGLTEKENQVALPLPILELQELVETSVDEDMKKEAQEALDIANQLFEDSKKRKDDFAKDFLRMKQKSTIDTALQEMRKL